MIGNFFTLSDYVQELRNLLHDPNDQYWPRAAKAGYINHALRRRDLDTGQNRVQFPFTLSVNVDTYSLFDVASQNPEPPRGPTDIAVGASGTIITLDPVQALGYQVLASPSWTATATVTTALADSFTVTFSSPAPAGAKLYWQLVGGSVKHNGSRIFDIVAMNLLYNNVRVVMGQFSLTELNTSVRQYMPPLSWAPVRWARYGPFGIVVAPAPSMAYVTEWDCSTIGAPLQYDADADLLPYPYTNSVPYYAAYLAKINERQNDEAEAFLNQYNSQVAVAVNQRVGSVPSMYVTRV